MSSDRVEHQVGRELDEETLQALSEIERAVRQARGDHIEYTPWDFRLPTATDLAQMREACDLTREEFGEEIDYNPRTIAQIENGHATPGRQYIQQALRLCKREWPRGEDR